jgi:hypothetical protein
MSQIEFSLSNVANLKRRRLEEKELQQRQRQHAQREEEEEDMNVDPPNNVLLRELSSQRQLLREHQRSLEKQNKLLEAMRTQIGALQVRLMILCLFLSDFKIVVVVSFFCVFATHFRKLLKILTTHPLLRGKSAKQRLLLVRVAVFSQTAGCNC